MRQIVLDVAKWFAISVTAILCGLVALSLWLLFEIITWAPLVFVIVCAAVLIKYVL